MFLRAERNGSREKKRNVDTNTMTRSGRLGASKPTGLRLQRLLERINERILHRTSDTGSMETPYYGPTGRRNI